MKAQDFAVLMAVLVAILVSAVLFGKCSDSKPQPQPQPVVTTVDPLVQVLKDQRRQDSLTILQLNEQIKLLQPKKETARKKATEAISKGNTAIQNNNCDSLKTAFQNLSHEHNEYQESAEQEMQLQGNIIGTQERVIVSQRSELLIKDTQLQNIATNYSGLQQLYDIQSKALAKAERKANRRAKWNRILGAAAIGATTLFLITK